MTSLASLTSSLLPAIESEMRRVIARAKTRQTAEMYHMMAYHLGWEGQGAGPRARGKRIRPLLLLLTTQAAGGNWQQALPAAASVELLHNFSLIHDDIQDNSPLRRGRPTVWKKWGTAQAINAGDAMYTLAYAAMLDLQRTCSPQTTLQAAGILHRTCTQLTQGQHLDMAYETRPTITEQEYWAMIEGKTASLLAACTELGALIAGANPFRRAAFSEFGRNLGLAFQVLDDLLGIWGDSALTGKSAESDLVAGKKSIPILFGLQQNRAFARRWRQGPIPAGEVQSLAARLEEEGAREYTRQKADALTAQALQSLAAANPQGEAGQALVELANMLLKRQV